jgi:hypothetical protein
MQLEQRRHPRAYSATHERHILFLIETRGSPFTIPFLRLFPLSRMRGFWMTTREYSVPSTTDDVTIRLSVSDGDFIQALLGHNLKGLEPSASDSTLGMRWRIPLDPNERVKATDGGLVELKRLQGTSPFITFDLGVLLQSGSGGQSVLSAALVVSQNGVPIAREGGGSRDMLRSGGANENAALKRRIVLYLK